MAKRKFRYFSCDFETTVYEGQQYTEVWASAVVELGTENVLIHHSIAETFEYIKNLHCNCVLYYHNLKFDGNFWLYYLIHDLKMQQATIKNKDGTIADFRQPEDMFTNTFSYVISDKGQWYLIRIKLGQYLIEIRDSLKLLPFSVKEIGKAFKTKHQKLEMEYKGFRYAGCTITDAEKEYIANDVLVVKEALEIMFKDGNDKLTIGACCMSEYKNIIGKYNYQVFFPDLTEVMLPKEIYGSATADEYIRHSYRGGWCYLAKGKENKIYEQGTTADVNSLYPSMMSSESGNRYPLGMPRFWNGNEIPETAMRDDKYFFVRIRTRFYLKDGFLPFVQIKGNYFYRGTEMLETSDWVNKTTGERTAFFQNERGEWEKILVTLTLTQTDFYLLQEHYNLVDFEILDGCYFGTEIGIFDDYIEKYKKIKLESKGAMRTEAKLFLNNLYGKMASSTDSSFKTAFLNEDGVIAFNDNEQNNKTAGYIAVGSAITSYARNFTIRAAQKNYYGPNQRGFIYADTDSIHCDLKAEEFVGVPVHDKNFCHWKLESCWDKAIFVRQKTYIEHITHEDLQPIENPYWNVKCAGMPDRCKNVFVRSMEGGEANEKDAEEVKEFLKTKRTLEDFKIGLKVYGKLVPKRIKGGVVLNETTYEMR